ncbi:MAG: macro domain-containing protein [Gemmatimonadetes bacterium]|nr:macro domain-containing protein [Gemmatimonadota bacterium]MCA9763287.1 macro domain-containing protein [Gemmatimonadota bacterium]MCB9517941.1 macro domain-containing protein [Gemmatimonadales bacterium]HPF61960.1 macro domain-containing protein [Gemmatimonadales bacterium]HRX19073.1 macro domain-containing protein [Gemmatimonadales bacterium]
MTMTIKKADITTLTVDAIVNAAAEDLRPTAGVSGAIHAAAGPELLEACERIGHCDRGKAVITSAYALPSRFVVHAVGPVWQGGTEGEAALLESAYRDALRLAHNHRCESVALPAISSGISGYPLDAAAEIAVQTTGDALEAGAYLEEVIFACHSDSEVEAYTRAMQKLEAARTS